jgi:hypothetical protein
MMTYSFTVYNSKQKALRGGEHTFFGLIYRERQRLHHPKLAISLPCLLSYLASGFLRVSFANFFQVTGNVFICGSDFKVQ